MKCQPIFLVGRVDDEKLMLSQKKCCQGHFFCGGIIFLPEKDIVKMKLMVGELVSAHI